MSEFQEKLQEMKEDMMTPVEDNPAFISSDLVDDMGEELPADEVQEEPRKARSPFEQRNERGYRKRKTIKDKLEVVLAENRAKDAQQYQLLARIQEQERLLQEAEAKAVQNEHYSNAYYEQSLDNEQQRVLTELKIAKENGDIEQEVTLAKQLADLAAQKQTQLLSKTIQRQQPQPMNYQQTPYHQEPQYQQQYAQEEPVDEHLEYWLEENPWADPRSSEYDQDLSQEVNELASELNKNLKFNRNSDMIGSPEYYNALSNIMNERYGVNTNTTDNNNRYVDDRAYEVAPVSKRGTSMADRYISNNQNPNRPVRQNQNMSLTKEEWEVATKLAPTLSNFYKRHVTPQEAAAEYYKQKMAIPNVRTR